MVQISPLAGKPAPEDLLVDMDALVAAYYAEHPDPADPAQRVAFGTSGHRGSSLHRAFNEDHILAVTQAICEYRHGPGISGPLFLGVDTHALSEPALRHGARSARCERGGRAGGPGRRADADPGDLPRDPQAQPGRSDGPPDGIVVTPSHNPPRTAASSTTRPTAAPPDTEITSWMQDRANESWRPGVRGAAHAHRAGPSDGWALTTTPRPTSTTCVNVVDLDAIRASGLRMGVDPLGGASVYFWQEIADRQSLDHGGQQDRRSHVPIHDAWTGTARSGWTAPPPTRWRASSGSRTSSTSPVATTPTPTGTAS